MPDTRTKATGRKPLHGNTRFERFRRKLADVVTVAINSGVTCAPGGRLFYGPHCPLGCHPNLLTEARPTEDMVMPEWDLTEKQAMAFFYGFDSDDKLNSKCSLYARLGRLYRERFS